MELIKQKRVEAIAESGLEKYQLCGEVIENSPVSDAECAAVLLDSIKFLATDLRTGLENDPQSNIILNASICTDDAKAMLDNLRAAFFSVGRQANTGSQMIKVVIAAKIG